MVNDVKITVATLLKPGPIFKELAADTVTPECSRCKVGAE